MKPFEERRRIKPVLGKSCVAQKMNTECEVLRKIFAFLSFTSNTLVSLEECEERNEIRLKKRTHL